MKKAIKILLMSVIICSLFIIPNCIETKSLVAQAATPTIVKVYVDDQLVKFDSAPYIDSNSRTMIPVRFVSEKLGATVEWNEDFELLQ